MKTDVAVIGAGLSGLTAAALLALKGLSVVLIEQHFQPGGSCGTFRRGMRTFDQGSSLFYGFGEEGFNSHRFVMDTLEEPITLVKHEPLVRMNFQGSVIDISSDKEAFFTQLETLFPKDIEAIKEFYAYIGVLYYQGILGSPLCVTPTEIKRKQALGNLVRHPITQIRLIRLFGKNASDIIRQFISSEKVIQFFERIISTYSLTDLKGTPAILAISLLMKSQFEGSYYPIGSSLQLPGKLEKAFEKHGGTVLYQSFVDHIDFIDNRPATLTLHTQAGEQLRIEADDIIYGGTLQSLYHDLLPKAYQQVSVLDWVDTLEMPNSSVVLYCAVKKSTIPEEARPIEFFMGDQRDSEANRLTVFRPSIIDHSICPPDEHLIIAMGPSSLPWPSPVDPSYDSDAYLRQKKKETDRILEVIEQHYRGFKKSIIYHTLATPTTIEYYTKKTGGAIAGPKQVLGQDLLRRHHASTCWENLFICGEGTVMGTGSSAVTISGISAANRVLRRRRMKIFSHEHPKESAVHIVRAQDLIPYTSEEGDLLIRPNMISNKRELMLHDIATSCQWCTDDTCRSRCPYHLDIRGVLRRLECGNTLGAKRLIGDQEDPPCFACSSPCEDQCLHTLIDGKSVRIADAIRLLFS